MTPEQYLANLKKTTGSSKTFEQLPSAVLRIAQSAGMDSGTLLAKLKEDDLGDYLYSQLQSRLPIELEQLFTDGYIAVGSINDESPEAYVEKVGDNGYAIVFHTGLKNFIYRIARALATRFFPSDSSSEHRAPQLAETARVIAEIFWWYQETGTAFGPSYEISDQQIQVASMLATEAEVFLLAHEIGHVVADAGLAAQFIQRATAIGALEHHSDEHAADAIGLRIALELYKPEAKKLTRVQDSIYSERQRQS